MNALIIPVYKNEETIADLIKEVKKISDSLSGSLTAVFVVDGSPDNSYQLLSELLPGSGFKSMLISHSRNFGSFAAIRTGMLSVEAEKYAAMAADLQEPTGLIIDFFGMIESPKSDVVFGVRGDRNDPLMSKMLSAMFWGFYKKFIVREIPKGGVDVFGCSKRVRDHIVSFRESNSSLIGQLFWLGYKREFVNYNRQERSRGKSAWTFRKKLNYLLDSIFAVTDLPIKALIVLGLLGVLVSVALGLIVLISKLAGLIPVSGYAAIVLTTVFFGFVNILGLGIVGSYAHRSYENSKNRPITIVADEKTFGGDIR